MKKPALTVLANRRVLVAEDEYLIATEIAEALDRLGARTLGPVACLSDGMVLLAAETRIDGALIDVNLRGEAVWPLVDALLERGVPVVLATGYDASAIPRSYLDLPRLGKPASAGDLIVSLARVLMSAVPA